MGIIISNWVLRTSLLQPSSIDRVADQLGSTLKSKELHVNLKSGFVRFQLNFKLSNRIYKRKLERREDVIAHQG